MKNEIIAALEKRGFNRWTKGNMDRLYINSTYIGLDLKYYKTGNISDAYINGERISNSQGGRMKASKNYIDIATGKCVSEYDVFAEAMREILDEVTAEIEQADHEVRPLNLAQCWEMVNNADTHEKIAIAEECLLKANISIEEGDKLMVALSYKSRELYNPRWN